MDILKSLLFILIGVGALNLSLILLDKQMNFNLKHWMMSSHGKDKALYLSSRFVGMCILIGLILSNSNF